jgi:hypothetical protein
MYKEKLTYKIVKTQTFEPDLGPFNTINTYICIHVYRHTHKCEHIHTHRYRNSDIVNDFECLLLQSFQSELPWASCPHKYYANGSYTIEPECVVSDIGLK